jgi:hypothetical protein
LILLKRGPLLLVVKGENYSDFEPNHEYHYNEHTCPTNYLRRTVMLIDLETLDTDPHGAFTYITNAPMKTFDELQRMSIEEVLTVFGITNE